ncbi:MAG: hypothetical protein M1813_009298 [Trichoglossum hirsutum]|nr:MAG: hypothetical protein M1813_009298 [Trichoglossum hirsutum]
MTTNSDDTSSHSQTASSDKSDVRESDRAKKRRRGTEDGQGQKFRAVGQNRKAIRAETRGKDKEIKAGITHALIEWGSYNPDFVTSGTAGEKELYDFLQQLEKVSTFAKTSADTAARFLSEQRKNSKLKILTAIQSKLPDLLQDDVILLTDATSLKNALNQPFQVPLLHRATTSQPSLAPNTNFGIKELLEHIAEDEEASISVYDYSISDPAERTYQTTVRELLSCFPSENARRTALNFLDIENRTNIQFCPSPIILQDIKTRLDAQKEHNKGKTGSEWKAELRKEFFLASMKNAISSIHADKPGLTWVLILTGRKIWYFPRHVNSRTIRWLAQAGSQSLENYEGGWVKVELRPGDLL